MRILRVSGSLFRWKLNLRLFRAVRALFDQNREKIGFTGRNQITQWPYGIILKASNNKYRSTLQAESFTNTVRLED